MGLGSGGFEFLCFTNRCMLSFLFSLFLTFYVGKRGEPIVTMCVKWDDL